MKIEERIIDNEDGTKKLYIAFTVHKATIFHTYIELTHERCAALRIAKSKEAAIEDFLNRFEGREYTKKEVYKAYSRIDPYFKDVYKKMFPHGGTRKGTGRPQGTTKNTGKTESFTRAITFEEKIFLERQLQLLREQELRDELAPYLRQIDEKFGDDEQARQKWRDKMCRMNPALYPQLLEHFQLYGIENIFPVGLKRK